jgi:hypothetical protein
VLLAIAPDDSAAVDQDCPHPRSKWAINEIANPPALFGRGWLDPNLRKLATKGPAEAEPVG